MALPIMGIISAIFPLLDKIIPDMDERNRVQAELTLAVMSDKSSFTDAMSDQIVEELKQTSWYIKGWRPTISWVVIFMNLWNWIIRPITNTAFGIDIEGIPTDALLTFSALWTSIYGIGRSFEKTGSSVRIGK